MRDSVHDALVLDRFEELLELDRDGRRRRLTEIARDEPAIAVELRRLIEAALHSDEPVGARATPDVGPWSGSPRSGSPRSGSAGVDVPPPVVPTGTRVGKYTVIGPIHRCPGESCGTVFRAVCDRPRRVVALKVIVPHDETYSECVALREAEILVRLDHPGIATVFDAGVATVDGRKLPYVVMELVDGRTLTQYAARRRLDAARRIELLIQVCEALQHAHQRGVIHRDIKPSNIRVIERGGRPQVKILDFGVAAMADRRSDADTVASAVAGTLPYMAPEALGSPAASRTVLADVYAMGVLAHKIFTGALPFEGPDDTETVRRILGAPAPRLVVDSRLLAACRIRGRGWRHDLDSVVSQCLEKAPERRHQSAAALAADLQAVLDRRPIALRSRSGLHRAGLFLLRHRAAAALVTIATLLGVATGAAWTHAAWERQRSDEIAAMLMGDLHRLGHRASQPIETEAERRMLVDVAVTVLDRLLATIDRHWPPGGPSVSVLVRDVAAGYERVERLQHADGVTVDDLAAQRRSARRAVDLSRRIMLDSDGCFESTLAFVVATRRLAALPDPLPPSRDGRRAHAEQARLNYEARRELARLAAAPRDARVDLEILRWRIEDSAAPARAGDDAAIAALALACAELASLASRSPECDLIGAELASARFRLGDALAHTGRHDEAQPHLMAALALQDLRQGTDAERADRSTIACFARAWLAVGAAARGESETAVRMIGTAVSDAQRLRATRSTSSGPRWSQYRTLEIVKLRHGQMHAALAERADDRQRRLALWFDAQRNVAAAFDLHMERAESRRVAAWEASHVDEIHGWLRRCTAAIAEASTPQPVPTQTLPTQTSPSPTSSNGARRPNGELIDPPGAGKVTQAVAQDLPG